MRDKRIAIIAFLTLIAVAMPLIVQADDPKAREIMRKVEDRDDGDNQTNDMLMVLIDKKGKERKKYFAVFTKDYGKDRKRIMFVKEPANVRNTAFLNYDYDDPNKDDDQWLYLPALGKPKRIANTEKDGSFMGSDLNYSDMTERDLEDYDYKLLKEVSFKGSDVWLIESLPRSKKVIDETGYKKAILAVRKDNYMVSRIKSWTKDGDYVKIMDFDDMQQIDGIWVNMQINVVKRLGKESVHRTKIQMSDIKFNQKLSDDLFTVRSLKKGL